MAEVFGAERQRVRQRIGSLAQVARVDSFVESEGVARGARRLRLVNGGGLEIELHPDRALDIGSMTVDGRPLAWLSATGFGAPAMREPEGMGWLRTFAGGPLATCGLDTFGPPSTDAGDELGQHGRVGMTPATVTRAEATWDEVVVEGVVRQARVFGEQLVLHRRIASAVGSDLVTVTDTVTNESFEEAPHMVLYHVNVGWPLLDDRARIEIPSTSVVARDEVAEAGIDSLTDFGEPIPGFREQVFLHRFEGATGDVVTSVTNPGNGLRLELSFGSATLPYLHEWKMQGQGHYVVGLEPSNCVVPTGRAAARAAGELPMLPPGGSVTHRMSFRASRAAV